MCENSHLAGLCGPTGLLHHPISSASAWTKSHGSHGRKAWHMLWESWRKGDHSKKMPWGNVMTPMATRPWTPRRESFQGRMVLQSDESSRFIMMSHDMSSWWAIMIHHNDSSWWIVMIHRDDNSWSSWWAILIHHDDQTHDDSTWWIRMTHHDESLWFIIMNYNDSSVRTTMRPWKHSFQGAHCHFAMGAVTFDQSIFLPWSPLCHGTHFIFHAFLPWLPWHFSRPMRSTWDDVRSTWDDVAAQRGHRNPAKWPSPLCLKRPSSWAFFALSGFLAAATCAAFFACKLLLMN